MMAHAQFHAILPAFSHHCCETDNFLLKASPNIFNITKKADKNVALLQFSGLHVVIYQTSILNGHLFECPKALLSMGVTETGFSLSGVPCIYSNSVIKNHLGEVKYSL